MMRLRGLGEYSTWRTYRAAIAQGLIDTEPSIAVDDHAAQEKAFRAGLGIPPKTPGDDDEPDSRGTQREADAR